MENTNKPLTAKQIAEKHGYTGAIPVQLIALGIVVIPISIVVALFSLFCLIIGDIGTAFAGAPAWALIMFAVWFVRSRK